MNKKISEESVMSKLWMRIFMCVVAITFGLTIGYSRLFLGMHTMNQIVFGLLLGVWIALSWHFIFCESLIKHSHDLVTGTCFGLNANDSERKGKLVKISLITLLLFVILMAVQIVNYFIVNPNIVIDPEWIIEISAKCDPTKLNDAFETKSLLQTGLIALGFGAYYGCVLQAYLFHG